MTDLERVFAEKLTENGDSSYNTTGNKMLDILFMTSYFEKHLQEVKIGTSDKEKLFSMFIRDPRFGLGRRDLGRKLMAESGVDSASIVNVGRFDDLLHTPRFEDAVYLLAECERGNELAKKWMPRLTGKDKAIAKKLCRMFKIKESDYRKLIKCDTVERKLSEKQIDDIDYEHVPSLAMIKYYGRFMKEEKFRSYLETVKKGEVKLNISTTTVYDIYKNRNKIDADLFFDKIEKISINCIPVLDTSGSMQDSNDSMGKAISIAHYLAKCSTYCKNQVISFSSKPRLMEVSSDNGTRNFFGVSNAYSKELNSMFTGDCTNTDLRAVMELLGKLNDLPEYIVILSDMEFDRGSMLSKTQVQKLWESKGYTTKIVWWNFNSRNKTVPELDEMGNVYISGNSPMMLKYLESGFDGQKFLDKLLLEYTKNIYHL